MNASEIDLREALESPAPVTWLFAGDSITQGAAHTRGWRDYTQLFRERLGELGRNEDLVLNTAVGGWSVAALEPRLDERILRHSPDVLFLMFGTNDAAGGADGLEAFALRYARILRLIGEAGVRRTIVQTTVPMMPVDPEEVIAMADWPDARTRQAKLSGLKQRLANIEAYVQKTREVAAACAVPLVDHWHAWVRTGGRRAQLLDGGFHPNEYGHRLIARALFRACAMWDDRSWTCRLFVPVDAP